MLRTLTLSLSLILAAPVALAGVSDKAYDKSVDLIKRLYLYPDEVEASDLLLSGAEGLADSVDWLIVESVGEAVYLSHGSGEAIGSVSVASMDTLPDALRSMETLVVESGYDLGDVDPRLEILKGMTGALDRYSRVLSGERLERFDVRLKGTLVGIGATLRLSDNALKVVELNAEGPAIKAGLQVDDVIVRIDGVSTTNMPLREATRRVRGEEDTQVVLEVQRAAVELEFILTRAEVVVPNVKSRVLADGVGYIEISHFSQRTVSNLRLKLDELAAEGALEKGLVIDLRGNTGGSMKEAARSADQFLTSGMLLRTAGPDGGQVQNLQARMDAMDSKTEPPVPIAVLMDDRTASGSEILAGALLELDRAVLIGSRSYGKGTVQKIYNLDEETRLKLTVAQYLLEGDRSIASVGLVPDTSVASIDLDGYGVRFRGWSPRRAGHPWSEIVPEVVERSGWRDRPYEARDVPLEIARRTVLSSAGPSREETLVALEVVAAEVKVEEEARLVEALEGKGIDWSRGEPSALTLKADVDLTARPDPDRPDVVLVEVEVQNLQDEPMHRTLVELSCDTFSLWSGLVVPVGKVDALGTAHGRIAVPLPPGIDLREDVALVRLRAEGRDMLQVGEVFLRASSTPYPQLRVATQLAGEGAARQAHISVTNLSDIPLEGLEVFFAAPGDVDVELIDRAVRRELLAPHEEAAIELDVRVGDLAPAVLPMHLVIESDRYRRLVEWPVDLPTSGEVVVLEAPRVELDDLPLVAAVGPLPLTLRGLDDVAVDHMVLYVNGTKVAWAPGDATGASLSTTVAIDPGMNSIVAITEDDIGLRRQHSVMVRGETEAAVDAVDAEQP